MELLQHTASEGTSHIDVQFASKILVAAQERDYGFLGEFFQQKICLLLAAYTFFKTKVIFFRECNQNETKIGLGASDLDSGFRFLCSKQQPENFRQP